MTQEQVEPQKTYYAVLGLHPSASTLEIRRSYRELSKRFHPDTTSLPLAIAKIKFQELNEAYATLSSPERRSLYDLKIGYSRINVIQAPPSYSRDDLTPSTIYTGPSDRPLSSGEIFALFLLGGTFVGCLLLAFAIAFIRGGN
ncbi:DnaJ-class molecular chaperone with C-terminal Zn finger domain [Gloeocapsa sp. PCC 73106]|nr:DnaJ-class molecular chaperone with C-terminal Zn finger domain [Gloeocapsa sp. PCC 73106]